jgi:hypothetical protein
MILSVLFGARAVAIGLGALTLEAVGLVLAVRAYRRTQELARTLSAGSSSTAVGLPPATERLELWTVVPPLLILGWMVDGVQRARAMILAGAAATDLGQRASLMSEGLQRQLGATLGGLIYLGVALLLGAVAAGFAASARRRRTGLAWATNLAAEDREAAAIWAAFPGPSAAVLVAAILGFVVLGLGPLIAAAIMGTWAEVSALHHTADADPAVKAAVYEGAQHIAATLLERGYALALVGVACAAIGSAVALWIASPKRSRRRLLGRPVPEPPPAGGAVVAAVILLVAAVALVGLARPMKRENATAWPPGLMNDGLGLKTPDLDGPDSLEPGPLVAVTATGLAFDRAPEDAAGIEARLRAYRANFPLLHPGEPAPQAILLACAPNADSARVFAVVDTARRLGYDRVRFVFERVRQVIRPLIGTVRLTDLTAALVSIGSDDASSAGAIVLRPDDTATCGQLAARVVESRRAGRPVRLLSAALPAGHHQPTMARGSLIRRASGGNVGACESPAVHDSRSIGTRDSRAAE